MSAAAQELAPDVAAGFVGLAVVLEDEPGPGGGGGCAAAVPANASAQADRAVARTGRRDILPLVSSGRGGAFSLLRVEPRTEPRIVPEPDEAERRAILAALERARSAEPSADPYRSTWRELGIRESVDASDGG
jgi:hypothetical protein